MGDELQTNVDEIAQILKNQAEDVLCVLSTVSCFAPRAYERYIPHDVIASSYLTRTELEILRPFAKIKAFLML